MSYWKILVKDGIHSNYIISAYATPCGFAVWRSESGLRFVTKRDADVVLDAVVASRYFENGEQLQVFRFKGDP